MHIWCYFYVLNLAIGDAVGITREPPKLFKLLNDVAVFQTIIQKNEKTVTERKHDKKTPRYWCSKGKSSERLSGSFGKSYDALWVNVIIKLISICSNTTIHSSISVKTDALFMVLREFR